MGKKVFINKIKFCPLSRGLFVCFLLSFTTKLFGQITLDVQEAYVKALCHFPLHQIHKQEVFVKQGLTKQAGLRPNPALDIEVEPLLGSGPYSAFREAVVTYELQYLIETGSKRKQRVNVALLEEEIALFDVEVSRRALFAEVQKALVEVAKAQEKVELVAIDIEISKKAQSAIEEWVQQGKEARSSLLRIEMEVQKQQVRLAQEQRRLEVAKELLASFWDELEPSFDRVDFPFFQIETPPKRLMYEQQARNSPFVTKMAVEISKAQAFIELQRRNAWPDVLVSAGVDQFLQDQEVAFKFEVNIPLPIFDANQGKIMAARRESQQAEMAKEQTLINAINEIRSLYQGLEDALSLVQVYQQTILSKAETHFRATEEAFFQGKVNYLSLLDAQKTWIEAREEYVDNVAIVHIQTALLSKYMMRCST